MTLVRSQPDTGPAMCPIALRQSIRRIATVTLLLLLATSGCGEKLPEFGLVEGTVKVKGQPKGRLVVRFFPDPDKGNNLPINSMGTTDAQGKFTLQHNLDGKEGPGAPIGWHRIIIEDTSRGPTPQGQTPPPPLISPTYGNPGTTPLLREVKSGTNTIDLEVK